jgi:hypothetical protein
MRSNKEERDLINALHQKRRVETKAEREYALFEQMLPALRQIVKAGGTADQLLKKSGPMAAYKLVQLLSSEKEEVVLKASEKIISYDLGKPVERSLNIYGDLSKMNEADVDNQIMLLLEKTGARKMLDTTLKVSASRTRNQLKQKRKPRQSDPLIIDADATVTRSEVQAEGTLPATEAGVTADTSNQGTHN